MPPKVLVEEPRSFKIQDFLAAYAAANNGFFFMINPVRDDQSGPAIDSTWLNIPAIGLSTHDRSKDGTLGFPTPGQKPMFSDNDFYVPEALLLLEVPSQALPDDLEGETWVIQVKEFEKMDLYQPIAKALKDEFKVNILLTPSQMGDSDPKHLSARPVNDAYPDGPQFQPILIRTVKIVK